MKRKENSNQKSEEELSREIIETLWITMKYYQEYIHYLQGGITKEEFKIKTKIFVRPFVKKVSKSKVVGYIKILKESNIKFDSFELSDLLDIYPEDLRRALRKWKLPLPKD